mmetsp:Transcript_37312/g.88155  ORF Transcript_37312/g.88155 Transcript_37312/m.88155 type:complete len:441 (-) Transcript_37312:79-1401(-)|eukprot:CAMPEP_0177699326 /NCGR_PEP_ID=MMETSP0484_2-20121128/5523_1 /TAXON_ID=354590 /ORGANISM="Rhodomonas lens, Strain RHODO" /LENGTH=440 /DNA_ID=CAMNT_0019210495 /DNA_START=245 /DNA_END=1567 /DNA_ORIENTATION=-
MHSEVLVTAGILAVVSSAVFAAVFNPLPPKPGVVGIDLGTTFSVIALFHNGSVEVVHDDLGKNLTPSTVAFLPSGDVLVGHPANDYGKKHPESVVFDAKRLIGHRFDEDTVQHDKGLLPFGVVDVGGNAHIQVTVGGKKKTMSPESVGAHVLTKLKKQVEKYIGRPVLKAVLAVPADFTEEQRNATMDAGRQAGLDVLRIISEPTAAALAYGLQQMKAANILVYDFGGGTLDVSLLMLEGGVFEVVSACGDEHLGGEDLTQGLLEWLLAEFHRETGLSLMQDMSAVDKVRHAAEEAKLALSSKESVNIQVEDLREGKGLKRTVTRKDAEKVWEQLMIRAIWPVQQVLEISGYERSEVDQIVLVGGTTRVPKVREMLQEYFDKEPNWKVDPDQAVAWGTAVQAGILTDAKGIKVAATEYWGSGAKKCDPLARPRSGASTVV